MGGRLREDRITVIDLERCPERRLWTGVLAMALIDALPAVIARQGLNGAPAAGIDLLKLDRARAWLRLSNPDFREVCELAGRDPESVFAHYQKHHTPRDQLLAAPPAVLNKRRLSY